MEKTKERLPIPNPDSEAFWDGCAKGKLLLQRCLACQAYRHPPSPICQRCLSPEHQWVAAAGRGTVYSYVIVHEALHGWNGEVPYVVALIELVEGPRMIGNVAGVPVDRVKIGMPVSVFFEPAAGEISLPKFSPMERK
jgi:uncharacterized OB-fold protein